MKDGMNKFIYYSLMLIGVLGVLDTILVSTYAGMDVGVLFPGAAGVIILAYLYIRLWVRKGKSYIPYPSARRAVSVLAIYLQNDSQCLPV